MPDQTAKQHQKVEAVKIRVDVHQAKGFEAFLNSIGTELRPAAAMGLNEHVAEQRRQSVVRISDFTGVPKGRVGGKTRLIKASAGATMQAVVRTSDIAIPLAEYGNPVWVRDLNPMADGKRGGSVSSMKGAEATGWNVRRQFPGAFVANGQVVVRKGKGKGPLKVLSMAVLANELAKPTRPNTKAAEQFAAIDMQKRVMRHVIRALGT
ncbi:hypothetical protein ASE36_00210 [Rhizobium sp. Root274]|nr:hypothetical protein ASC71_00210 [Rhizobium sp. Root1240]KRD32310.1 hypothetical protein ASE36_00210 [Rhizobium sp. Root274]